MNSTSAINRWVVWLGIVSFLLVTITSVLFFGIGAGMEEGYRENKLFPEGFNAYRDLALRSAFISILFLMSTVLVGLSNNAILRVIALILSGFAAYQCMLLISSTPSELPFWLKRYSQSLQIVVYIGHFFFVLSIVFVLLQFATVWCIVRAALK